MSSITTTDGTSIFYKDWGAGAPVLFSHCWPLNADTWDEQMMFLAANGLRTIAHDRRGHGRSSQPWNGNDMDTYADDLAALIETLDLKNVVLVGHSAGGGEIVRYIGRHGTARVAKMVLLAAVTPLMLKTEANPGGLPISVFDGIRQGVAPIWLQGMQCGLKGVYDCVKAFSETDTTEDLKSIDVPTLIIHGDDDQIVPIGASALRSAKLVPNATLKIYPGAAARLPGHDVAPAQ